MDKSGQVSNEEKIALLPNDNWVAMERKIYWHLPNTQQADGHGHKKHHDNWHLIGMLRAEKGPGKYPCLVALPSEAYW